jgi:hypothetical protein
MEKIGMETESSDRSPPFAVEDEAGLGRTDCRPIDRQSAAAIRAEEEQQDGAIRQRRIDPLGNRSEPRLHCPPVLGLVAPELLPCFFCLGGGNIERHAAVARHEAAVDADGSQNQRSLLGLGKRLKPANFDQLRHLGA